MFQSACTCEEAAREEDDEYDIQIRERKTREAAATRETTSEK